MKNKHKKILILTGIFPPAIGGPAAQLEALCCQLVKCGYKVKVLTYGKSDKKYFYPVIRVSNKIPSLIRKIVFIKFGLILSMNADIVYSWDLYTSGLTGLLAKKILRKKVINRFAGDSAWEKATNQKLIGDDVLVFQNKLYSKQIERWKKRRKKILLNSDAVIVVSEFLKNITLKIGISEKKIKVIYNSVDFIGDIIFSEEDLNKLDLNGIVLISIARLVPWKGMDMLIEIMPELIKKYKKISLVIIGSGSEDQKLKNLIKELNIEKHVFIKGRLDKSEIIKHLNIADILLLNTNYEGLSHTILEAIKFNVPVITTNIGGNPEVIIDKQTGLLVNYRNKEQWIRAIQYLLDNSSIANNLADQAILYSNKFNWNDLIEKTVEVFENI